MPYTTSPTFAELKTQLAQRLGDSGKVHWVDAELGIIINEAIQTWNRMALYYKARGQFPTVSAQAFYDLTLVLKDGGGNLLLGITTTVQKVCSALEYSLMEPQTVDYSVAWTGTEMFTFAEITDAIQKRADRFLQDTGILVRELSLIPVTAGDGLITVSGVASTNIRRVAWKSLENTFSNLWRVDEETLNRRLGDWNIDQGTPTAYSIIVSPDTQIQLAPVPIDDGNLHVIAVQSGPTVDLINNSLLGVYNDFVPFIQWGARAELLGRDGPAMDIERAGYCEQRWQEGIALAKMMTSTLQVRVNDRNIPVNALERIDFGFPDWQHTAGAAGVEAPPITAGQESPNLIALYKVPNDVAYSITVDTVRNALTLSADSDRIQLSDEIIGPLLGECVHIALFKDGGAEFQASLPLHRTFWQSALEYNSALKANAPNIDILKGIAQAEWHERPMETEKAA